MNALVIYYSKYGNTRRIAARISDVLNQAGKTWLVHIDHLSIDKLQDIDLLVIGSPTYYQAVPKDVKSLLKTLPQRSLYGKWVAVFDTSLKMWGPIMQLTAAHGLMSRLRKLGGKKIAQPETFLVRADDTPDEGSMNSEIDLLLDGELNRAENWARTILKNLASKGVT